MVTYRERYRDSDDADEFDDEQPAEPELSGEDWARINAIDRWLRRQDSASGASSDERYSRAFEIFLEQRERQLEYQPEPLDPDYLKDLETGLREYQYQRAMTETAAMEQRERAQDELWATGSDFHRGLAERWREMQKAGVRPNAGNTAAIDVNQGVMMYLSNQLDPDEEPTTCVNLPDHVVKEAVRNAGPHQEGTIYVRVNRIDQWQDDVSAIGIPQQEFINNNFPNLRAQMHDLSLDASLSWKAAELVLDAYEQAMAQGPPGPMAGYNPQLREFKEALNGLIESVEATTPADQLHDDQSYTIAVRAVAMVQGMQSQFEFSNHTRNASTDRNIAHLRVSCAEREAWVASLEGDQSAMDTAQASLDTAMDIRAVAERSLRQSSFTTAVTVPTD